MPNQVEIDVVREFIKEYKKMPYLWNKNHNKQVTSNGYKKLLEILKKWKPNATEKTVKKEISNRRSSYRRVLDQVRNNGPDFVPKLWYFKDLEFLSGPGGPYYAENQQSNAENFGAEASLQPQPSASGLASGSASGSASGTASGSASGSASGIEFKQPVIPKRIGLKRWATVTNLSDGTVINREISWNAVNTSEDDAWAAYVKSVTDLMKTMNKKQAIYTRKLIGEAVCCGALNLLSINSKIV